MPQKKKVPEQEIHAMIGGLDDHRRLVGARLARCVLRAVQDDHTSTFA